MPGSRRPGPQSSTAAAPEGLRDGTNARTLMPGGGPVGLGEHVALAPAARTLAASAAATSPLIDEAGVLKDARVKAQISPNIERGKMAVIRGIVVHQTGGDTAASALESYKKKQANGAHFLIDKDGTIYQTASLHQRTWHVGKLQARCLVEHSCTPVELKAYKKFNPAGMHESESAKSVPARYPSNEDGVGIELVGKAVADPKDPKAPPVYEKVTDAQNVSLKWLVRELTQLLGVPMTEVFRHPEVSWKNKTEASTAQWQ